MPAEPRNNANLKRIVAAFRITHNELRDILSAGGLDLSKNHVSQWLRRHGATRRRANSQDGKLERIVRYREMTDNEFDAFCSGLALWAKRQSETDGATS